MKLLPSRVSCARASGEMGRVQGGSRSTVSAEGDARASVEGARACGGGRLTRARATGRDGGAGWTSFWVLRGSGVVMSPRLLFTGPQG